MPTVLDRASTFGKAPAVKTPGGAAVGDPDKPLLELYDKARRECFADRFRYERVWTRAIHYTNMRQWLGTYDRTAGWMDSRVARGVPKPVTSKPKEGVQAIRAMFTAAQLGVDVRPLKNDVKSMTTATTADKLAPVLYTSNEMDIVLHEGDYWFIVCGNVVYHVSYDDDGTFIQVPFELCRTCGNENTSDLIAKNGQKCPQCGKPGPFTRAVDANGQPKVDVRANGHTVTTPLSPLEVAFPFMRARWSDVDRLIRMRWRTKAYYESHPELAPYVKRITFAKTSTERSLQIFQSLPFQTELSPALGSGYAGSGDEEGVAEYELWEKPTPARPDGFVMRVAGDSTPLVLHIEESEGLPGPLPYHEANGNPRWTFHHACYEHVGGRVLGTGALDPAMNKFDQLNRLDSIVEMMMTRMAIPQVIKPKGQEIQWLGDSPAMPGLIAEYAPAPGGGKPEQWPGQDPPRAWAQLRLQLSEEIDAALGCLRGDTQIPCLDGKTRSMVKLAEQFPNGGMWVYGFDTSQMRIVPAEITQVACTGVKPCVRVLFKEGTAVECTHDHPFLTWDRGYVEAQQLRPDDAIVPLMFTASQKGRDKGYTLLIQPADHRVEFVHRMVGHALLGLVRGDRSMEVHHVDRQRSNNLPNNLELLTHSQHCTVTRREMWAALSPAERSAITKKRWANVSPEQRKAYGQRLKQTRAKITSAQWSEIARKRELAKSPEEQAARNARLKAAGDLARANRANHRVAAVIPIKESLVYDLTTSTHNYGTAAGVFVHNTNDILRGRKPPNVEAFSAMQLLVEAGEARFAGAFKSRALAFRDVTRSQVEIEREFGPDQRVQSVVTPGRGYNFQTFQKADLDGEVTFDVADGSTKPKTQLAERASIEHLKQLGGINIADPDTKYAVYQKLGQTDLIPATDNQHQCALQNQELFMAWVRLPAALSYVPQAAPVAGVAAGQLPLPPPDPATDPTYPFILQAWYEVPIHRVELVKWAVSDEAIELFKQIPQARYFVGKYLGELDAKVAAAMTPPADKPKISYSFGSEDMAADAAVREAFLTAADIPPPASRTAPVGGGAPQGAGRAMANSNQNSAPIGNQPQPAMPAIGVGANA